MSKFWSDTTEDATKNTRGMNAVLDDTVKALTDLSNTLKKMREYHDRMVDDLTPTDDNQSNGNNHGV